MIIKGNSVGYPLPDPRKGLEMQGGINMNGQKLNGLNAPMAEDEAANMGYVKRAYPHNLLDNSDFRNPVNQRGYVSGSTGERKDSLDRWILEYDTNLHLHSEYVGISGFWALSQKNGCKLFVGKTYTFAIEAKSEAETGVAYIRLGNPDRTGAREHRQDVNANEWTRCCSVWTADRDYEPGEATFAFGINSGNKLDTQIYYRNPVVYEGEYTAETLPEYQPKGYGAELAECMRYYQRSYITEPSNAYRAHFLTAGSNYAIGTVFFYVPMRITPTVTIYNPVTGKSGGVAKWSDDSNVSANHEQNVRCFYVSAAGGVAVKGETYTLHYEASADL